MSGGETGDAETSAQKSPQSPVRRSPFYIHCYLMKSRSEMWARLNVVQTPVEI